MNDDLDVLALFPNGCRNCGGREFERDDMVEGHVTLKCVGCKSEFGGIRIGTQWFRVNIFEYPSR